MKLFTVTLTGADETVSPHDLFNLSDRFPWVEWGILFSDKMRGQARYPDAPWIKSLLEATDARDRKTSQGKRIRMAAHICGRTMRAFLSGITSEHYDGGDWLKPFGLSESEFNFLFGRAQINFNASRENFSNDQLEAMMRGWYESMDGSLITQHNPANVDVWSVCQKVDQHYGSAIRAHHILHDASGGRGKEPASWDRPIAGLINGYAGGMGPDNVIKTLSDIDEIVGPGYTWIDMEGKIRDTKDAFDLDAIEKMLLEIESIGHQKGWL